MFRSPFPPCVLVGNKSRADDDQFKNQIERIIFAAVHVACSLSCCAHFQTNLKDDGCVAVQMQTTRDCRCCISLSAPSSSLFLAVSSRYLLSSLPLLMYRTESGTGRMWNIYSVIGRKVAPHFNRKHDN